MDRALHDYLVQGNAANGEVDDFIDFCLMLAKGEIKAKYKCYRLWAINYAIFEHHMKNMAMILIILILR